MKNVKSEPTSGHRTQCRCRGSCRCPWSETHRNCHCERASSSISSLAVAPSASHRHATTETPVVASSIALPSPHVRLRRTLLRRRSSRSPQTPVAIVGRQQPKRRRVNRRELPTPRPSVLLLRPTVNARRHHSTSYHRSITSPSLSLSVASSLSQNPGNGVDSPPPSRVFPSSFLAVVVIVAYPGVPPSLIHAVPLLPLCFPSVLSLFLAEAFSLCTASLPSLFLPFAGLQKRTEHHCRHHHRHRLPCSPTVANTAAVAFSLSRSCFPFLSHSRFLSLFPFLSLALSLNFRKLGCGAEEGERMETRVRWYFLL